MGRRSASACCARRAAGEPVAGRRRSGRARAGLRSQHGQPACSVLRPKPEKHRCGEPRPEDRGRADVSGEGQCDVCRGACPRRRKGAGVGARGRIDARLRLGGLCDSGRRGSAWAHGPQGDGAPARGRSHHRVARLGRPRADDRPGRVRRRIHSRRGLVRSRGAVNVGVDGEDGASGRSSRIDAVDCARGLALVGMAVYHLSWDLADFRLASPMLPFTPQMLLLSHVVASAFLLLVGVSLALAHRNRLNVRAFWRRLAIVAGAAALVTAGSLLFAPSELITFGILHCIAVASLLAGPFVTAPAWASLAIGLAAIAAPWLGRSTLFDSPWVLWFGLGEALPNTLDWRPLLPWAGVVFLGLGAARLPGVLTWLKRPDRWRAESAPARWIGFAGCHSLPIYLVHQPILIGLLAALTAWGPLAPKADRSAFLASCQRACVAEGRAAEECATGCRCVADAVDRSGDADRLATVTPERRAELKRLADACMGR